MTFERLRDIAMRRGVVQWIRSGRVERIRVPKDEQGRLREDRVLALNLALKREHPIFRLREGFDYHCIELDRDALVTPAQLGF